MFTIRTIAAGALYLVCLALAAQPAPLFEVDPFWPKPLPDGWLNAQLPGVCVDSHDHVVVLDRRTITADQAQRGFLPANHILMFNQDGDLVSSWGDPDRVPLARLHGCSYDADDNLWITGNRDGIIQKYSHSGELLMQIGTRGVVDTADGTAVMAEDGTLNREALKLEPRGFLLSRAGRRRSRQWRHLRCRRLRQPAHRGLRQGRAIPSTVGTPGIASGDRVRGRRGVRLRGPLRCHQQGRSGLRLRPRGRPHPGIRQTGYAHQEHLDQDRHDTRAAGHL